MYINNKKQRKPERNIEKFLLKSIFTFTAFMTTLVSQQVLAACNISPDSRYEFIENININGIELANGAVINSGDVINLNPGYSSYRYNEYWSIWIDLNHDASFDGSDELILQTASATSDSVQATIVVPNGVSVENAQFRVLLHADPASADSCGYNSYGDVHDFSVNINPGSGGADVSHDYQLITEPMGGSNEHIASITLAGGHFSSGDDQGYADYSSIKSFEITDGDPLLLTPNSDWSTDWGIWIDSDNNGSFDTNEQVFSGSGQRGADVSGILDLSGITAGNHRVRVAMSGDSTAAADGFRYGEIEDYAVNVIDGGNGGSGDNNGDSDKNYGPHVQWEHDSVTVKIFRFEFNDVDLTWSVNRLESEMAEIVDYFDKSSYGRFEVNYEIYDDIIQVGENITVWDNKEANDWKDYYAQRLIDLGEAEFWNIDDSTIYLILAPQISDWGIKAGVNPGAIRLYDTGDERSQAGGIAHEMGHAMGLHHAQGLDGQDTVFGVGDYDNEMIGYGNAFSLMGNNAWDFGELNLYYKNFFKSWGIEAEVPLVTQSGTYRIYAFDQGSVNGDIGLRLAAGNGDVTYWIEYRTKDAADTKGVLINTQGYFPDEDARSYYYGTSFLLDMTPNTHPDDLSNDYDDFDDFMDGALVIGKSYTDKWGAFTITPQTTGGTLGTAGAWIEIDVQMH